MKNALITGGVTGIGAAIAEAMQAAGYAVAVNYHSDEAAASAFRERTGIEAHAWDVASGDACVEGVRGVESRLGPLDVLVNNAGITSDAMLHRMTFEQWRRVIATNLDGCFNMCRAVVPGMRERRYGRIINIASVNGQSGQMGQTNYAASKAGLIGFTKSLALESAACGITVNAIAPGYTATAMTASVSADVLERIVASIPVHRMAEPREIARAAVFLAADDAAYITGTTLSINGGRYMA